MNPRRTYREAAVAGASPVRLIIMLYEQVLEDLGRALTALRQGDIESRAREINHAILVIGHLQASLDMERGGKVAGNLERFYGQIRAGLVEAHARQSASLLERRIADLLQVHEAWCEIERLHQPGSAVPPADGAATSSSSSSAGWNA
jgi:flagellar secretion chaperone FliS